MWKLQPPPSWKKSPPLSQQPPSKAEVLSGPPLFENLVGDSTPPAESGRVGWGGSGAHYEDSNLQSA